MKHVTIVHGVNKINGIHHIDLPGDPDALILQLILLEHKEIWVHVPKEARYYVYYWLRHEQGKLHNFELA